MSTSDVVERYLQDRLSEAEKAAFEEAYLSDPALLDELELTEKLQSGLRAAAADGSFAPRRERGFLSTPHYAAAASALLALSLITSGWLLVQNLELRESAVPSPAASSTRLLQLVAVRGDDAMTIAAPAPGEWTVFLLDPGFGSYEQFDAVVTRAADGADAVVWEASGLRPDFDGMIVVGMPGALLAPGDYSIALGGREAGSPRDRDSTPAGGYRFRIAPAAGR